MFRTKPAELGLTLMIVRTIRELTAERLRVIFNPHCRNGDAAITLSPVGAGQSDDTEVKVEPV